MSSNRTLYSYMYDPNDGDRRVGIGRKIVDENGVRVIKFAYSVNNPGRRFYDSETGAPYHCGPKDPFNKKKARQVIDGRLEKDKTVFTVNYDESQHPMDTIRTYIALNSGEFPRSVVRASDFHSEVAELRRYCAEQTAFINSRDAQAEEAAKNVGEAPKA